MLLYIYTSVYIKHKLFLFGLDRDRRPYYVYVHAHPTYFYVMTKKYPDEWNTLCPIKEVKDTTTSRSSATKLCPGTVPQSIKIGQDGEAHVISNILSSIGVEVVKTANASGRCPIKVKRMHRMDSHSNEPVPHYVVPFASFEDMHKARTPLIKEGFNISELPHDSGKFFADKEMLTCQWVEIDDEHIIQFQMSHGDSSRKPIEIAIDSMHITKANPTVPTVGTAEQFPTARSSSDLVKDQERIPLIPPPVKMCAMDIEAYSTRYGVNGSRAHPEPSLAGDIIYAISMVFHNSGSINLKTGTAEGIKKYCIFVTPSNASRSTRDKTMDNEVDVIWDGTDEQEQVHDEPFQLDGVEMVFVNSEQELLIRYSEIMRQEDPDVLYGYNVFGFDYDYISKRSKLYQIETYSRLIGYEGEINGVGHTLELSPLEQYESRQWEGAGHSWHSFTAPYCYGRICLDTFNNAKTYKADKTNPKALQSHKLGDVGAYFVGHTKRDVVFIIDGKKYDSYAATYLGYRSGNVEMLKVIADYCVQDTIVTMLVMDKLKGWESARESAIIFNQDVSDVTRSGQTKHIKDSALRLAESIDGAFHSTERKVRMKLEGGYVQSPKVGKHDNVCCLDFSSMYPTTQMAYNISPDTFKKSLTSKDNPANWVRVRVPIQLDRVELPAEMQDYTGPDGETFDIGMIDNEGYMRDLFEHNHFSSVYLEEFIQTVKEEHGLVQPEMSYYEMYFLKNTIRKGIFPLLLEQYRKSRKEYQRIMKTTTDQVVKDIYDQKQNAVKVAMNSVYGISGSSRGMFSFLEGSAAITYLGRTAIKAVAQALVDDGCEVIYGDTDSVMIQSPGYVNQGLTAPLHRPSLEYFEKKTEWINEVLLADRKPMEIEAGEGHERGVHYQEALWW